MPVTAAVVRDDRVRAALAARDMPAERDCAAALDRTHDLHLVEADVAGISAPPRRPEVAEDIRDLESWTGHGRPPKTAAGPRGVAGCRCGVGVTEESPNDADIGPTCEQLGRKTVAQRMQRHRLLDAGR